MNDKNENKASKGVLGLFHGTYVWAGIAFAVIGYLAEELIGGQHAFEFFLLFGGFFMGIGLERNRANREKVQSGNTMQT